MKEIEEFLKYSKLYMVYRGLFTKTQQKYLDAFFIEDNSFSEIAQGLKVTRQAVFDNVKKACTKLNKYEKEIGYIKLQEYCLKSLHDLSKNMNEKQLKQIIKKLEGI